MCINCNLIVPLKDECADILGVPRRKYLTLGHTTVSIMFKRHDEILAKERKNGVNPDNWSRYVQGYSNTLVNYLTEGWDDKPYGYFEWEKDLDSKKIVKDGVYLYESKIKILKPLPKVLKRENNSEYYKELFDGEIVFEEE